MTELTATLDKLVRQLNTGEVSSRFLVENCLTRIQDENGEGRRAFIHVDAAQALMTADAIDRMRTANACATRFSGIPISVKDLFDVQGQVTTAGSNALRDRQPAQQDATVVARLRQAGFVIIGRTNMTEFAYSGLGLNPHYGTPLSPWQRQTGHAPGGSSSGAGVSVADEMCHAAIGTDTGGSCRIPAAFTGVVGYKPTTRSVSSSGVIPLAPTLDAAGPIARSVGCCASIHAVMSGEEPIDLQARPANRIRLAIPQTVALDSLDRSVGQAFERAISILTASGVSVADSDFSCFADVADMNRKGGLPAMEGYAWHRKIIAGKGASYDPRVLIRLLKGRDCSAVDYLDLMSAREALIACAAAELRQFDAIVLPTVAIAPPELADLQSEAAYDRANALALRNTGLVNMIDGCAISIPIHRPGETPVGLMLACSGGCDRHLLALARDIESLLESARR